MANADAVEEEGTGGRKTEKGRKKKAHVLNRGKQAGRLGSNSAKDGGGAGDGVSGFNAELSSVPPMCGSHPSAATAAVLRAANEGNLSSLHTARVGGPRKPQVGVCSTTVDLFFFRGGWEVIIASFFVVCNKKKTKNRPNYFFVCFVVFSFLHNRTAMFFSSFFFTHAYTCIYMYKK